nr:wall-associated receptor kinase 3-like [Quercus suber]
MGLHGMLVRISLIWLIVSPVLVAAASLVNPPDGCPNKCGDVEIPYPFGLTKGCSLDDTFLINCSNKVAKTGTLTVTNISIEAHDLHIMQFVARDCYKKTGEVQEQINASLSTATYTISKVKNKFTVVGCDTSAYLHGFQKGERYTIGCTSVCNSLRNVVDGSCSGVGCCEVEIPDGSDSISVEVKSFKNHTIVSNFNPCGYAFVVERGKFNFSHHWLRNISNDKLPMVLKWAVGNEKCQEAAKKKRKIVCEGNSECTDNANFSGYRCNCKSGYRGNPYLSQGCQDIDECENPTLNDCTKAKHCVNKKGGYTCGCPKWHHGDGRKNGEGCIADPLLVPKIAFVAGISLIAIVVVCSWLYFAIKKRRLVKLKEKYFRQNGGLILQQQPSSEEGSSKTFKMFTAKELKKATGYYDKSKIIGRGGYGTVYKGFLPDNRIVAIKKSKTVDENQIEQFINEVVVLSQINHRNVVKLLGCCLETRVPLLVYEYVPNGALFNHIHKESITSTISLSWNTRLRIAIEIADALSYLHSAASIPIIHRDVKSTNILLDDNFTAKVSDFGTSRLVPRDQKQLVTVVQGTLGYLDPEFMQTNQLTEKSDVYSFGVVLVELLTGQKALSFARLEEQRSLAMYFLYSLKENQLFEILEDDIVEQSNMERVKEFAKLAAKCLELKGDERPTMKEVAIELDGLRKMEKHPWDNVESN